MMRLSDSRKILSYSIQSPAFSSTGAGCNWLACCDGCDGTCLCERVGEGHLAGISNCRYQCKHKYKHFGHDKTHKG
jgi:hypothetical protein